MEEKSDAQFSSGKLFPGTIFFIIKYRSSCEEYWIKKSTRFNAWIRRNLHCSIHACVLFIPTLPYLKFSINFIFQTD